MSVRERVSTGKNVMRVDPTAVGGYSRYSCSELVSE